MQERPAKMEVFRSKKNFKKFEKKDCNPEKVVVEYNQGQRKSN